MAQVKRAAIEGLCVLSECAVTANAREVRLLLDLRCKTLLIDHVIWYRRYQIT